MPRTPLEQASLDQLAAYVRDYYDAVEIPLDDPIVRRAVRETSDYLEQVAPSGELRAVVDALRIVLAAHG